MNWVQAWADSKHVNFDCMISLSFVSNITKVVWLRTQPVRSATFCWPV